MAATSRRGDAGTAARILDVAERLLQDRGFNGFSYADVAAELNITKPALHYHFASKAELGEALIARYTTRFLDALAAVDSGNAPPPAKLEHYARLYLDVLRGQRMCLCGMLAAEYTTLPRPMQASVMTFFDRNEAWLEAVLEQGRADGSLRFGGPARETARLIVSCLEGAMLVARPYHDIARYQTAAANILAIIRPAEPAAATPRAAAAAGPADAPETAAAGPAAAPAGP
jgi:TetR/AcrR family transcriptional regulator, transcriptional repressor for nem operon